LSIGYLGFEVTFRDAGKMVGGRLEDVGMPGAHASNPLGSVLVSFLPFAAPFLLTSPMWLRCLLAINCALSLNVLLLTASRGAFLGAITSVIVLFVFAPRELRKRIAILGALGAFAAYLLLGDPRILARFWTTFASAEQRDNSAASRLVYWQAGLQQIADHPFGAGGDGFKRVYGSQYLRRLGESFDVRAVHNGYINETCEWGMQGVLLRLAALGTPVVFCFSVARPLWLNGRRFLSTTAISIASAMAGYLITCMFGDRLDAEWGLWLAAFACAVCRIVAEERSATGEACSSANQSNESEGERKLSFGIAP
jgi:O-antigen ligase